MNGMTEQAELPASNPGQNPPGAGQAMRVLSDKLTLNQAERLSETIRSRASLANALAKFEERASAYSTSGDPRAIGPLASAARALALDLNEAGVRVSTSDLVRGLRKLPEARSSWPA